MPESSFIAQHRENMPPPDRTTTSIASWRETATGRAAAAVAHSRGRSRGGRQGRARGRGRGRARGGRGGATGGGMPYWLWGEGEPSSSQQSEPEEYQDLEINNSQNAPTENEDDLT